MIEKVVSEINTIMEENKHLKEMLKMKEYILKDQAKELLKYRIQEYENTSYKERMKKYEEKTCRCCIRSDCGCKPPKDILKPFLNKDETQVLMKGCNDFEWD